MTEEQQEAMEAEALIYSGVQYPYDANNSMSLAEYKAHKEGYKTALSLEHLKLLGAEQLRAHPEFQKLLDALEFIAQNPWASLGYGAPYPPKIAANAIWAFNKFEKKEGE